MQVNTPRPSLDVGRIARQFPVETRVDAHAQTDTEETDDEATLPPLAPRHDLFLDTGASTFQMKSQCAMSSVSAQKQLL